MAIKFRNDLGYMVILILALHKMTGLAKEAGPKSTGQRSIPNGFISATAISVRWHPKIIFLHNSFIPYWLAIRGIGTGITFPERFETYWMNVLMTTFASKNQGEHFT